MYLAGTSIFLFSFAQLLYLAADCIKSLTIPLIFFLILHIHGISIVMDLVSQQSSLLQILFFIIIGIREATITKGFLGNFPKGGGGFAGLILDMKRRDCLAAGKSD